MREKTLSREGLARARYEDLEQWVGLQAQEFIQDLLDQEMTQLLGRSKPERKGLGVDWVEGYRNGYGKTRSFAMMGGTLALKRPRVRGLEERFESRVLPLFRRHSRELRDLLLELYLHELSSGDFELAKRSLLGEAAPLSGSSLNRLKSKWELELEGWKQRDLSGLELVYWWADGLYVKAGIADRKSALLTIGGATSNGEKIVLALEAGERESKESWLRILRDLTRRGLKFPRLTIADGALGLWSALGEVHPEGDEQRCWNHKIVNVLDR